MSGACCRAPCCWHASLTGTADAGDFSGGNMAPAATAFASLARSLEGAGAAVTAGRRRFRRRLSSDVDGLKDSTTFAAVDANARFSQRQLAHQPMTDNLQSGQASSLHRFRFDGVAGALDARANDIAPVADALVARRGAKDGLF